MLNREARRSLKNMLNRAPAPVRDRASPALLRGYEILLAARQARTEGVLVDNGLPVPPARLRVAVVGHADAQRFLEAGKRENQIFRDSVSRAGRQVGELHAILDWGCGCGRLARWWSDLEDTEVHGCDYNPRLVEWVHRNLPFVHARVNHLEPPLPYPDDSFDAVYALSIFTHLTDENAIAWMEEIRRVLRADGLFFFTTHGVSYDTRLSAAELDRFERGESVVQFAVVEGTNLCAAYHPKSFVENKLTRGFEIVEALETRTLNGDERQGLYQDRYLIRKTA